MLALARTFLLAVTVVMGLSPGTGALAEACGTSHQAMAAHAVAMAMHPDHHAGSAVSSEPRDDGGSAPHAADPAAACCTCCIAAAFVTTQSLTCDGKVLVRAAADVPDALVGIAPEPVPPPPKPSV